MAIFKPSIVWGLFEYSEFLSGAQRLFDRPVYAKVTVCHTAFSATGGRLQISTLKSFHKLEAFFFYFL
jgi:hypothetical protein